MAGSETPDWGHFWDGGADRNRTCDLLIANETLYQLSYDPIHQCSDRNSLGTNGRAAQQRSQAFLSRLAYCFVRARDIESALRNQRCANI